LFAAIALAAPASARTDGLQPIAATVFADAAKSCAGAVSSTALDEARLAADGWSEGKLTSADGKPEQSELRFLGRGGVIMLLMGTGSGTAATCTIMARASSVSDLPAFLQATAASLGGPKIIKSSQSEVVWMLPGGRAAQFNTTGTKKKPSARVTVIGLAAEKK
jgi:hypothetical protein